MNDALSFTETLPFSPARRRSHDSQCEALSESEIESLHELMTIFMNLLKLLDDTYCKLSGDSQYLT